MADEYGYKIGFRGKKRAIQNLLDFMATQAAQKAEDSYFYEEILRPSQYHEDYGLTANFAALSDEQTARFVSCGDIYRAVLTVLPLSLIHI